MGDFIAAHSEGLIGATAAEVEQLCVENFTSELDNQIRNFQEKLRAASKSATRILQRRLDKAVKDREAVVADIRSRFATRQNKP